jgi:hypothetical protein
LPRSGSAGRSSGSGAPHLFPVSAALLAALGPWLGCGRFASCGARLESPETQIRKALANQGRAHLDEVYGFRAGGTAELSPVRYADVVASLEGDRATVVALLEAEGRVVWRGESAEVSYLGREKFHMRPCSIAVWCAEGDQFARLRSVLLFLFRREDAFNAGDPEAYARLVSDRYRDQGLDRAGLLARLAHDFRSGPPARERIRAWQIRVDRDAAEVGEDYTIEIQGQEPRQLRARYTLALEGERWLIVAGL